MRGLSGRVPPLALRRLATPMRRVSARSTATATTATTAHRARALAAAVGRCAAERRAGQLDRIHRAVAVHRDVQRRRPRVSCLSWLSLSGRQGDDGATELWRRVHR